MQEIKRFTIPAQISVFQCLLKTPSQRRQFQVCPRKLFWLRHTWHGCQNLGTAYEFSTRFADHEYLQTNGRFWWLFTAGSSRKFNLSQFSRKMSEQLFGGQKSLPTHTLRVYTVFRHPKLYNKDGRLICLDCATPGPWREQPTFSHFLWYSRRKCKVGENAVLGLSMCFQ